MGTPDFAIPTLQALLTHYDVIGVVTQPDRPAGRKNEPTPPPVKRLAEAHNIPVFQPEKLRSKEAIAHLATWEADLFIVAAFGQILPKRVLDLPRFGCINVHGSLLPRWRGAAPIHASIRHGDTETGITIMLMDEGLDTGDMLTKRATPITPQDTAQTLHDRLAHIGAELLVETIQPYLAGEIAPQKQEESLVTYAPQITKEEGRIDWSQSAQSIERLVRAFTPWPSTYTFWEGKQVKFLSGSESEGHLAFGQVGIINGRIAIGTGNGVFVPSELQLEGKKRVSIEEFMRGYPSFLGAILG